MLFVSLICRPYNSTLRQVRLIYVLVRKRTNRAVIGRSNLCFTATCSTRLPRKTCKTLRNVSLFLNAFTPFIYIFFSWGQSGSMSSYHLICSSQPLTLILFCCDGKMKSYDQSNTVSSCYHRFSEKSQSLMVFNVISKRLSTFKVSAGTLRIPH